MIILAWVVLQLGVQLFVGFRFPRRIGKGRIFTRPFWGVPGFRPYISPWDGTIYAANVRVAQFGVIFTTELALIFTGLVGGWLNRVVNVVIILLYLDDYVTGDDEKWKRFKETLKNAVKWKMPLPARSTQ